MKEFVVIDIRDAKPEEVYQYLLNNGYTGIAESNLEAIVKRYEWTDDEDESIIDAAEIRDYYHNSIEKIPSFFLFNQLDKERVQI